MRIAHKILWNGCGIVLPLAVGAFVMPATVRLLGTERFGVLSIVWLFVGYFSVFDLGLGRALTKLAADRLAEGREHEVGAPTSAALRVAFLLGSLLGAGIALAAPLIADHVLHIDAALRDEALAALYWLATSLPFVLVSSLLLGTLEGYQRFAVVSINRTLLGTAMYLAPFAIALASPDLFWVTGASVVLRIANAFALYAQCRRLIPQLRPSAMTGSLAQLRPLLHFGGWLTVSSLVSPFMVYFDRFFIAAALGATAVTYYTVPYEVLTRLWIIPTAVQGVMFPVFAGLQRQSDSSQLVHLFRRSTDVLLVGLGPPVVAIVLFAGEGLGLWMGEAFAERATVLTQILAVGVLANALARNPFGVLQSAGLSRWTALLHLAEIPFYAAALLAMSRAWGLPGIALAWTLRAALDAIVLYLLVRRAQPALRPLVLRDLSLLAAALIGCALLGIVHAPAARVLLLVGVTLPAARYVLRELVALRRRRVVVSA
jgi:O-antigen/teichoic acid export membrane protein